MRTAIWNPLVPLSPALTSGRVWGNYLGLARETFATGFTCPPERVTVVMHEGPTWSFPTPPADVAADPGRLAYWQRQEQAKRAEQATRTYYLANGCNRSTIYRCNSGGEYSDAACLRVEPLPPSPPVCPAPGGGREAGSP